MISLTTQILIFSNQTDVKISYLVLLSKLNLAYFLNLRQAKQRRMAKIYLRLTIGSKFEHNDYTGFEYQPTVRLLWIPYKQHTVHGWQCHALCVPTRFDVDYESNGWLSPDLKYKLFGNKELESEVVVAYELGYRFNVTNHFLLDTNLFYNEYDNQRTFTPVGMQSSTPAPTLLVTTESNQKFG